MFSKKDIVDLIKRTPRENSQALSFDYSLPAPDRDFGETRGGKPKWAFDFQKNGGLTGWIQRAKDYQDMRDAESKIVSFKKGLLPGDVSEERLSESDKEKAKKERTAEKINLLRQLVAGQDADSIQPILTSSSATVASLIPDQDIIDALDSDGIDSNKQNVDLVRTEMVDNGFSIGQAIQYLLTNGQLSPMKPSQKNASSSSAGPSGSGLSWSSPTLAQMNGAVYKAVKSVIGSEPASKDIKNHFLSILEKNAEPVDYTQKNLESLATKYEKQINKYIQQKNKKLSP